MVRYKIKLPTDEAFREALGLIEGQVPLYVRSEKRRTLSVGDLPSEMQGRIRALGGDVRLEERYDLEKPTGA